MHPLSSRAVHSLAARSLGVTQQIRKFCSLCEMDHKKRYKGGVGEARNKYSCKEEINWNLKNMSTKKDMYPNSLKFPLILVSKCHFTDRFLNTTTMALTASYYSRVRWIALSTGKIWSKAGSEDASSVERTNWRRACKPQKVVAWGRTHRVCSSVDHNRVRKFCSRNRLTLMLKWQYMRTRHHAFRTLVARHDGYWLHWYDSQQILRVVTIKSRKAVKDWRKKHVRLVFLLKEEVRSRSKSIKTACFMHTW